MNKIKLFNVMKKTIFLSLVILLIGLCLILASHFLMEHSSLNSLMQAMKSNYWFITACRYAVYGVLIVAWPYLINKWGQYKNWPADVVTYLSDQRVKLCMLFIIIEVLFVYNLLGHLLVWL